MNQFIDTLSELEGERAKGVVHDPTDPLSSDASISAHPIPQLPGAIQRPGVIDVDVRAQESIGIDEVLSRLWQRKFTLLGFAATGIVLASLFTIVRKPVYRARTTVELESPVDADQNPLSIAASLGVPSDSYLQNELKILESESLARRVADRLEVESAPPSNISSSPRPSPLVRMLSYFALDHPPMSAEDLRIRAVQRSLIIRPSLKSDVVEIDFDSHNSITAAIGANAVVSEYIAMNREAQAILAQNTTEWLSGQIAALRSKLDKENEALKEFAGTSGLLYSADQDALAEQRVGEVQEQLTKAEAERATEQSRYETAVSSPPQALPDGPENSLLHDYEANLVTAERDLIQLRSMYTPKHYKVIAAESRVAQLQASINQERQNVVERMRADFDASARLQRSLESSYRSQTEKLQSQSANAFRYSVMKHELDSTQQLYDSLLQKSKEAAVASALHATSVRIIDVARPPAVPYSPNLPLSVVIGLSLGSFLGMVIIFIQDHGLSPMGVPVESRTMKIRELGSIPVAARDTLFSTIRQKVLADKGEAAPLALATWHTESPQAESYRSVLTSILFSPCLKQQRQVLAVTSVAPQEGKTTTITNLGIALAETCRRVLLIDGDLHRPNLHRIFGHCNDTGLTSLLSGDESMADLSFDSMAHSTQVQGLFVLPSGPGAANITPLIHSARMVEFLARARQEFDCILIDTPPTSLCCDARLLGSLSDSVILVFDANNTSRDDLKSACLQFLDDGTNILGAIRNRSMVGRSSGSYGYY